MGNTVVLGMQWGDEGKGKIVDLICPAWNAVVRFQGGHNAGHTVKFADRHFALHFLPSGILQPAMRCVLGNGMVVAPEAFLREHDALAQAGIETAGRLFLSTRAQVILPAHQDLDQARENARGRGKIGTTGRGIGPAYETKAARTGLRLGDLAASDLENRLTVLLDHLGPQLSALGAPRPQVQDLLRDCATWAARLAPFLADTTQLLSRWLEAGERILFEGAQGAMLDVDHGTYPYVTSSNTVAAGACIGAGVPPTQIHSVFGVLKAYSTRVGSGPFTTELHDAVGEHLRQRGNEFGTVTGRPRRCGWFDAVAARYARQLNGVGVCALTKLDVLDELEEIAVCTGYRYRGQVWRDLPAEHEVLTAAEPVYRWVRGWRTRTAGILDYSQLPAAARDYLALLADEVGVPIGLISTGPRREETLFAPCPQLERLLGTHFEHVRSRCHAA